MSEPTASESEPPPSDSAYDSHTDTDTGTATPKAGEKRASVPSAEIDPPPKEQSNADEEEKTPTTEILDTSKLSEEPKKTDPPKVPEPPSGEKKAKNKARVRHPRRPIPSVQLVQPFSSALSTVGRSPAVSLSSRHYTNSGESKTPGPGAYNIPPVRNTVSPKFRDPLPKIHYKKYSVPGPGAYSPTDTKGGIPKGASLSPKLPLKTTCKGPAPGTYDLPGGFATPGAGFSFGGDTSGGKGRSKGGSKASSVCITPGPGSYSTEPMPPAIRPGFSLGGKWRSLRPSNDPGPGAYDPDTHTLSKSKAGITLKGKLPLLEPLMGQGPSSNNYNVRPPAPPIPSRSARNAVK